MVGEQYVSETPQYLRILFKAIIINLRESNLSQ